MYTPLRALGKQITMLNKSTRRKSTRLKSYDYSKVGAYFVTICTHERENLFGEIVKSEMILSDIGRVILEEWLNTEKLRKNVQLDEFTIMPNHFHAIVIINQGGRGVLQYAPTANSEAPNRIFRSPSQTIGAIIRGFKSAATHRVNELRRKPGFPVWQRNYYEHVIRNDEDLTSVREYIANNYLNWEIDAEYN